MFSKTVSHFHAGGLSEMYPRLTPSMRFLFRMAYFNSAAGIRLSEFNPQDAGFLLSGKEFIIPNGIKDPTKPSIRTNREGERLLTILYVGAIREGKGLLVLLEAARILRSRKRDFRLEMMGSDESVDSKKRP
jgi:glycosyltransferase involved in cell wall biosynthesis